MTALAQGGHGHHLSIGIDIGPLILRMAVLAGVTTVAGFVLLRGFLAEPDRRTTAAAVGAAGGAATVELLLSGGLRLPEQLVPLLLLAIALPLYLVLSTDPRFARVVGLGRSLAPWLFAATSACALFWLASAWLAGASPGATATALHTGVVLALVALAWFVVARAGMTMRVAGAALASALILAATQAVGP